MAKDKERTLANQTTKKIGEKVRLNGWVQTIRDQGNIKFIVLRDVSGTIQVVVTKDNGGAMSTAKSLTLESVVEVIGLAKEESQAPDGVEVVAEEINVLSKAAPELPIPVVEKGEGKTSQTKRLNWRWIDLRKAKNKKIFDTWTSLEKGFREYLDKNDYIQVYAPSFMSTPSESGSEVFKVQYFEKEAFLAQSPQFYKQAAMAAGFEKVFMTGPVFRAELSFTTRHMTEFTGWDFEISFIESHFDVMEEEEKMLISAFKEVKDELDLGLEIPEAPFPKIALLEAKEKLKAVGVKSEKEYDVSPEEEREISKIIKKETGHDFVFLTDYPIEARPFYHMRLEDNPKLTRSFDLLYKGIEITTGAQREHRIEVLRKQAEEKGMNLGTLNDYLNFFKYGCPPHGGGGLGPGRIVMKILDLRSVKEATFFPRDVKRLAP